MKDGRRTEGGGTVKGKTGGRVLGKGMCTEARVFEKHMGRGGRVTPQRGGMSPLIGALPAPRQTLVGLTHCRSEKGRGAAPNQS